MYFDPDTLRSNFRQLDTDELLDMRTSGALTDEAQVILGEVLAERIDNVPPAKQLLDGNTTPSGPTDKDVAEFRKVAERFRRYFSAFPLVGLPILQVRGILWIVIAMFGGRMLAAPLVKWVYISAQTRTDKRVLLTALALGYPVLVWSYVNLLRFIYS